MRVSDINARLLAKKVLLKLLPICRPPRFYPAAFRRLHLVQVTKALIAHDRVLVIASNREN